MAHERRRPIFVEVGAADGEEGSGSMLGGGMHLLNRILVVVDQFWV